MYASFKLTPFQHTFMALAICSACLLTACQQTESKPIPSNHHKLKLAYQNMDNINLYINKLEKENDIDSTHVDAVERSLSVTEKVMALMPSRHKSKEGDSTTMIAAASESSASRMDGGVKKSSESTRSLYLVEEAGSADVIYEESSMPSPHIKLEKKIIVSDEARHDHLPKPNYHSGLLAAGMIDDNLNLNFFSQYLKRSVSHYYQNDYRANQFQRLPYVDYRSLSLFKFEDKFGKGVGNAKIDFFDRSGRFVYSSYTSYDGRFALLPFENHLNENQTFTIKVHSNDGRIRSVAIDLDPRRYQQAFGVSQHNIQQIERMDRQWIADFTVQFEDYSHTPVSALDVMLVIDTTGSMSDELRYLQTEFDSIISRLKQQYGNVDIRVGLTFYRDRGDQYVVKDYPFNSNIEQVKSILSAQNANGGGDYPEAMGKALQVSLAQQWRDGSDVSRVMFLVADAPPHNYALQNTVDLMFQAREKGVHVYPIAASGAADTSEYIMRVGAQLTHGQYLFLTDDSGVGNSHAEPKVACYQVTHLDRLVERVIASELAGYRIDATESELLRTSGKYKDGRCS